MLIPGASPPQEHPQTESIAIVGPSLALGASSSQEHLHPQEHPHPKSIFIPKTNPSLDYPHCVAICTVGGLRGGTIPIMVPISLCGHPYCWAIPTVGPSPSWKHPYCGTTPTVGPWDHLHRGTIPIMGPIPILWPSLLLGHPHHGTIPIEGPSLL